MYKFGSDIYDGTWAIDIPASFQKIATEPRDSSHNLPASSVGELLEECIRFLWDLTALLQNLTHSILTLFSGGALSITNYNG